MHQQEVVQVRARRTTRGREPKEERLTRRDQRRDSCLRRVSSRRQERPSRERERERERGSEKGVRERHPRRQNKDEGKIGTADRSSFSSFFSLTLQCILNHSVVPKTKF